MSRQTSEYVWASWVCRLSQGSFILSSNSIFCSKLVYVQPINSFSVASSNFLSSLLRLFSCFPCYLLTTLTFDKLRVTSFSNTAFSFRGQKPKLNDISPSTCSATSGAKSLLTLPLWSYPRMKLAFISSGAIQLWYPLLEKSSTIEV